MRIKSIILLPFELILFVHVSIVDFLEILIKVPQVENDFEESLVLSMPIKRKSLINFS